jgi:exonuclease III
MAPTNMIASERILHAWLLFSICNINANFLFPQRAKVKVQNRFPVRIVSWNMARCSAKRVNTWTYLLAIDPDIAMLQEVVSIPETVLDRYEHRLVPVTTVTGSPSRYNSVILLKRTQGEFLAHIKMRSPFDWVQQELDGAFAGLLCSWELAIKGTLVNVVNVHSPAHSVPQSRLVGIDTSQVRHVQRSQKVWGTHLLTEAMRNQDLADDFWFVGGDFNSCVSLKGNIGVAPEATNTGVTSARLRSFGLTEALSEVQGGLTPTYKNRSMHTTPANQLDYLWVSRNLAGNIVRCTTGDTKVVMAENLSDHLPIIAEFVLPTCAPTALIEH